MRLRVVNTTLFSHRNGYTITMLLDEKQVQGAISENPKAVLSISLTKDYAFFTGVLFARSRSETAYTAVEFCHGVPHTVWTNARYTYGSTVWIIKWIKKPW